MPSMLTFKVLGAMGMASYALAHICTRLPLVSYHRYKLIAVPIDCIPDMPRGYSSRMLDAAELADHSIDIDVAAQAARFARGLQCLGIFDRKDELIGIAWLGRRVHDEGDMHVRYLLPKNAAWDTGMWLREDKRMGRGFSAIWGAIKIWLRDEGLDCTMSSIADYNVPSILSHRRLGSRRIGFISVVRIGPLQYTRGARPSLCLVGRGAMPTVHLV
jgi:hypothetical protein